MIAKYTPVTIDLQPGDEFVSVAGGFEQWRGVVLVATFLKTEMTRTVLTASQFVNSGTPFAFYVEENMPGVMATLTGVQINESSGEYTYSFGDGTARTYASRNAAKNAVAVLDTDTNTPKDFLIAQSLRKDGEGSNASVMVGQSCTVDCAALSPCSMSAQIGGV